MQGAHMGLAKVAVQYSADSFLVNQTLVLRIKFSGKNRHLRQARKRYRQGKNPPSEYFSEIMSYL